jgi:hypothetical protein
MMIPAFRSALAGLLLAATLPLGAIAAPSDTSKQTFTTNSSVSSGQKVTGHRRSYKSRLVGTSPDQPAPVSHEPVAPSARLADEPNQIKEQVAPIPAPPVKPGTNVAPGNDTPKP